MDLTDALDVIARVKREAPPGTMDALGWRRACDTCAGELINTAELADRWPLAQAYTALCRRAEGE